MANLIKAFFLISTLIYSNIGYSQSNYTIEKNSEMSVSGTSTLHDWTSIVTEYHGNAKMIVENGNIISIDRLKVVTPVVCIDSGNSIMDGKTYKALKKDQFPEINYELKEVRIENGTQIYSKGTLVVAGVTKEISMPVSALIEGQNINITGKISFNMTDFDITPPTALMGSIKTGDQITIDFSAIFKPK